MVSGSAGRSYWYLQKRVPPKTYEVMTGFFEAEEGDSGHPCSYCDDLEYRTQHPYFQLREFMNHLIETHGFEFVFLGPQASTWGEEFSWERAFAVLGSRVAVEQKRSGPTDLPDLQWATWEPSGHRYERRAAQDGFAYEVKRGFNRPRHRWTVILSFAFLGGRHGHSTQFAPETAEQIAADLMREASLARSQDSS